MSSSLSAELRRLDTTKTISVVEEDEESASGNWLGLQASGSVLPSDCKKSNRNSSSFAPDKKSPAVNKNTHGKQSRQATTSIQGNAKGLRSVPVLPESELQKKVKTTYKPRLTKEEPLEKAWKQLMDPRGSYRAEDKLRFSEGSEADPFRVTGSSISLLPSAPEDTVTTRISKKGYPLDGRRSGVDTDGSMDERAGAARRSGGGGSTTLAVIEPFNSHITRRRLTGGLHDGKKKMRASGNDGRLSKPLLDSSPAKDERRKNVAAAGFRSTEDDALFPCISEMTPDSGRSFTPSVATTKGSYPGGNTAEDFDSCMVSRTSTSCPSCSLSIPRQSSNFRGTSDGDVVLSPMSRGPSQNMTLSSRISTSGQKHSVNLLLNEGKNRRSIGVDTLTVGKPPLEPPPPKESDNADARSTTFERLPEHHEIGNRALEYRKTQAIPITSSSQGLRSEVFQDVSHKCVKGEEGTIGIEEVRKPHKSATISEMKRGLLKKNETNENSEFSRDFPKERGDTGKQNCSTALGDLEGKTTSTSNNSESSDDSTCDIIAATQETNDEKVCNPLFSDDLIQPPPSQKCDSFMSAIDKDPTPDAQWNSNENSSGVRVPLHIPPLSGNTCTTRGMNDFIGEKRGINREKEKNGAMNKSHLPLAEKVAASRQKSPSVTSLSSTSISSTARSKTNPPGSRREINATSATQRNLSKGVVDNNEIERANSMHSFRRENSTDSCLHSLHRLKESTHLKGSRNGFHIPLSTNIRSVSSSVLSQSDLDVPENVFTKRIVSRKRPNEGVKRSQKDVRAVKPQNLSSQVSDQKDHERNANGIALEGSPCGEVMVTLPESVIHDPAPPSATDASESQQVENGASPTDGPSRGESTGTALHRCSPTPQARVSRTITASNASWKNYEQQEGMTSLRNGKTAPQFFCC